MLTGEWSVLRMWDLWLTVEGSNPGFRDLRLKLGFQRSGFSVHCLGFRVQGAGFRVQGTGHRALVSRFRVLFLFAQDLSFLGRCYIKGPAGPVVMLFFRSQVPPSAATRVPWLI